MKYVAIVAVVFLGLVEMFFRMTIIILFMVSLIGIPIVFVLLIEDDFMQPYLFGLAERIRTS